MVKRKLAGSIYPTVEISFDGTTFTQVTKMSVKTETVTFKLGEAYEHNFAELGVTKKVNPKLKYYGTINS